MIKDGRFVLPQDIGDDDSSAAQFIGRVDIFYPYSHIPLEPTGPQCRNAHIVPLRHLEE